MAKKEMIKVNPGESKWDGTLLSMIGVELGAIMLAILMMAVGVAIMFVMGGFEENADPAIFVIGILVILLFYTIGLSWASIILVRWDTSHTVISGQRLQFKGTPVGFFFNILKWLFLTMITFGIYGIWMYIKVRQWQIKNVVSYPDGEEKDKVNPGESKWDGTLLSMIGVTVRSMLTMILAFVAGIAVLVAVIGVETEPDPVMVLVGVLVFLALIIIGASWASIILLKWDTSHTVISGQRLKFNGNTVGLCFNMLKWVFLTMITFGIYAWWMTIKIRQWQIKNTVSYLDSEGDELPEVKKEEIDEDDGMITFQTVQD